MEPPKVRSPPYFKSNKLCPGKNYTLIIVIIIYNIILAVGTCSTKYELYNSHDYLCGYVIVTHFVKITVFLYCIYYIYLTIVVNSVPNNNIKQNMKWHCSYIIGVNKNPSAKTLNNLCGDLNKGFLPVNPMKQNVLGSPYPLWVLWQLNILILFPCMTAFIIFKFQRTYIM